MAAVTAAKKALRQRLKKVLSELSAEAVDAQTNQALKLFFAMPEYRAAQRISVYLSMPRGEISTSSIVHDALQQGKHVFVPYIHTVSPQSPNEPSSIIDMLSLHSLADYKELKRDKWGIPTLSEASISDRQNCLSSDGRDLNENDEGEREREGLDIVVMPGMAFDTNMNRLGHGKGYYDFFLQRYHGRQRPSSGETVQKPFLVALALKDQVLPPDQSVPTDSSDWTLDGIIIGDGRFLRANRE
ncbi:MAG: hypothetical protein M1833_004015 [Piccolia ochrophora]|nr:MAG: hypothetical protein M1833_004015 [Piccolia ochrophora]